MNLISPTAQINKLHTEKEGKHYRKRKRHRKRIGKSNKWGFLWSPVTMIQVHPGILLHPMILLGELFQRPHLFGRTRTVGPWGREHGLSFPLEGVHGISTSLRFHISVDVSETSRPPGCGQRPGLVLSPVGEGGREVWRSSASISGNGHGLWHPCTSCLPPATCSLSGQACFPGSTVKVGKWLAFKHNQY